MSFAAGAEAYDRFMGRYSIPLAPTFADFARIRPGQRVLDVGCGPGALTAELVRRVGPDGVAAVDPTDGFVVAARARHPGVDVRMAAAEELPFADASFDVTLAQLVVHFMADPLAGLREMARVTRGGGVVSACVWDQAESEGPLPVFWAAARSLDSSVKDEADRAGARRGDLTRLFAGAGLEAVEEEPISVTVSHASFEEWWEPFLLRVGPAGLYVDSLDPSRREALKERCRERLSAVPLVLTAVAWAARGVVGKR